MYNKILVPLDGSNLSECVLPHVEFLLKSCGIKEVIFMRVVESLHIPFTGYDHGLMRSEVEQEEKIGKTAARNYLEELIGKIRVENVKFSSEVCADGQAAEMISDYASQNDVDLIVIATHGRSGISRWAMGSTSDRVLRSSCVPILMVRAPGCIAGI